MDTYLAILNLAYTVCTARYSVTDLRANPVALIEQCANKKAWCMNRSKTQRAIRACLED